MRGYDKNGQLETITCSRCKEKLMMQYGIIREECINIDHTWGYFSEKDRQVHHFDLCEGCYDELASGFRIPVNRKERTEFLQDGVRGTVNTVLLNMYPWLHICIPGFI